MEAGRFCVPDVSWFINNVVSLCELAVGVELVGGTYLDPGRRVCIECKQWVRPGSQTSQTVSQTLVIKGVIGHDSSNHLLSNESLMAGRDSDPLGFFGHRSLFCVLDVIRTALFDSIFDVGHDLESISGQRYSSMRWN